jgi:hypothetical protein
MRLLALAALLPAAGGCVLDELTATHVEAGGAIHAALAGGADHVCTALADGKDSPFAVNGFSTVLTFGLVGATDSTGVSVLADIQLATPLPAITVPIGAGSTSQLEIHLDGSGCAASSGVVNLHVDASGLLQGDFNATGAVSGSTAPCQFAGTIVDVPLDR